MVHQMHSQLNEKLSCKIEESEELIILPSVNHND